MSTNEVQASTPEIQVENIQPLGLPGDNTNLCKIVKSTKQDNVTYNNYEQKIVSFIVGGGIGALGFKIVKDTFKSFVAGGLGTAFVAIPTQNYLYTTTQHRECTDSLGIHQYLIIEYYSDSARTNQLYVQYLKVGV